jgi:hypothetical protein
MHPTDPRRRPWPTVLLLVLVALLIVLVAVVVIAPPVGAQSLDGVIPDWAGRLGTGQLVAVVVVGEVRWVPDPSPLSWLAGAAVLAMAAAVAARTRHRTRTRVPRARVPEDRGPAAGGPRGQGPAARVWAVDNDNPSPRRSARLPLRGTRRRRVAYPDALWRFGYPDAPRRVGYPDASWRAWYDRDRDGVERLDPEHPEPARVTRLHVTSGGQPRRRRRVPVPDRETVGGSTSATVLAWPGRRHDHYIDHDPDLPGGA